MECCVLRLGCSLNSNSNQTELNWTELNWTTASNARGGPGLCWACTLKSSSFYSDSAKRQRRPSVETALKNAVRMHKSQSRSFTAAGDEAPRHLYDGECARLQLAIFDCAIYMWKKKSTQNSVRTCSSVVKCIAVISIFQSIKLRYFKPMICSNFQRCNQMTKTLIKSSMKIAYK